MENTLRILTIESKKDEDILRTPSKEIPVKDISKYTDFFNKLLNTAKHSKELVGVQSVGIASPQVGKLIRAFYVKSSEDGKYKLYINPRIKNLQLTQRVNKEGCLSIPNIEGNVSRFDSIQIEYLDIEGNKRVEKLRDWDAVVAQHEYDHLEGILFIDKLVE